jgi:hypothetical protein
MHCVAIGKTGAVHWVMQRPDNTYMDPAGGAAPMSIVGGGGDRTTRAALKASGQRALGMTLEYHGTGLAIRLQG